MIEADRTAAGEVRFILSANGSLSYRHGNYVLMGVGLALGGIALGFYLLGLWLVLPFAGFEWLFLAWAIRKSQNDSLAREVLTIGEASLVLERGTFAPADVFRFQRAWLRFDWVRPQHEGYPSRILLGSHGKKVEVGAFLAEPERKCLARELRQILVAAG